MFESRARGGLRDAEMKVPHESKLGTYISKLENVKGRFPHLGLGVGEGEGRSGSYTALL